MAKPTKDELIKIALDLIERDENQGLCLACGEIQDCVEPDARQYKCETCGEWQVFGHEEVLLQIG